MLTYMRNHAPVRLIRRSYCEGVFALKIKKPNSKSFVKYPANLTSVITTEL